MVANVPDYVRPDLDRARDLEQLNRFAEAIEVYRGVIGRYPEIAVLHNGLGCAFANLGKRDQAAIEFREAIRLTALNRQQGLVTPRTYPQEPEQNLRAVLGKTLPGRVDSRYLMMLKLFLVPVYALVAAIVYTVYLRLSGKPWGDSYAYVQARQLWFLPIGALFSFEPSDFRLRNGMFLLDRGGFAFSDLIPLIKVWNHANRRYLNRLLWVGLLCGASVGYYLARARGWPGAAYYAFFWALSVESFMFVLGLQFCQRRQEDETTWKVRPVLKIMYWLFFALIADVALVLLKKLTGVNGENAIRAIWRMQGIPNSALYENVGSAICLGIVVAFPSKLLATYLIPHPLAGALEHAGELGKTVIEEGQDRVLGVEVPEPHSRDESNNKSHL